MYEVEVGPKVGIDGSTSEAKARSLNSVQLASHVPTGNEQVVLQPGMTKTNN